ncbi:MAG: DUF4271 domain-containing protein, partial [Bacteroidota bacterium]|nr:DUF4271 domain-containing protein [Bacteroidota bacterium]
SDDSTAMWYSLLILCILIMIKIRDQVLFFSITRISQTNIPSTKKINAPSENIKIQDIISFAFRGFVFGYFVYKLLVNLHLINELTPIYLVIGVWLGYTTAKFVLEFIIGLFWKSWRMLLEVILRRGLLKTKAAFILFISILFSNYPPIDHQIYWGGVGLIYILYYIIGYQSFAKPYQQLIQKRKILFISYICTLEIGPIWVLFVLLNQTNT